MNISNRAVLVNLAIPTAAMTRTQRDATTKVLADNHAKQHVGRFIKNLLPAARASVVQSALNDLRQWHYSRTQVWDDCGTRLLSAQAYMDYCNTLGMKKSKIADIVREHLVLPYDQMLAEARAEQGELFDIHDMPGPAEIERKLQPRLVVLPVPTKGHLMVDLPAEMLAEAQSQLEQDVEQRLGAAMGDAWGRVSGVLERVVDRLGTPDAVFRNSLIENVRELVEVLPYFNMASDPKLAAVTQGLRDRIAAQDPEKLRQSPTLRATVAQEAAGLLAQVRGNGVAAAMV